jgi:hypothetical protein
LLVVYDWRLAIGALGVQYVGMFVLVLQSWPIELAVVKLVTGWIAASVIGMALMGLETSELPARSIGWSEVLFRLFASGLVLIAVFSFGSTLAKWLPTASFSQVLGGALLVGMGLLQLGFTARPLRTVIGLLTVLTGFEILYATIEASTLLTGLLAVIHMGVALAGAYLILAPTMERED